MEHVFPPALTEGFTRREAVELLLGLAQPGVTKLRLKPSSSSRTVRSARRGERLPPDPAATAPRPTPCARARRSTGTPQSVMTGLVELLLDHGERKDGQRRRAPVTQVHDHRVPAGPAREEDRRVFGAASRHIRILCESSTHRERSGPCLLLASGSRPNCPSQDHSKANWRTAVMETDLLRAHSFITGGMCGVMS